MIATEDRRHIAYTGVIYGGATAVPYSVMDGPRAARMARGADIAVDIETAGLGDLAWQINSVQIATTTEAHVLHPVVNRAAIEIAIATARRLFFHNSPFDVPILVGLGFMRAEHITKVFDTLTAARMAAPSDHGGHDLARACSTHLPELDIGDKGSLAKRFRAATGGSRAEMFATLDISSEAFCTYAARDAVMTAHLAAALPEAMRRHTLDCEPWPPGDPDYLLAREQTINRMMLTRTCRGIEVDFEVIDEITNELKNVIHTADLVLERYGIDISLSPPRVKETTVDMLDELGVIPASYPKLKNGRPTARRQFLEQIDHPMTQALRDRSMAHKFIVDYSNKMGDLSHDGRIHPQVSIAQAVTGRMSMSHPPLQQYPASVRRMMRFDRPATSMDWSSIEPVVIGNLAGQTEWIEQFEAGGDLYVPVAEAAGVSRKTAKVILLAQLYGQGITSLGWSLGLEHDETKALIDKVMGPLDQVRELTTKIKNLGNRLGRVQTVSGRMCPIARDSTVGNRGYLGYKGVNYVVQGGAYDLLAEAIVEMHRQGLDDALYVAVHDELVVATDVAHDVEQIMRTAPPAFCNYAGRTPQLRVGATELGHYWMEKPE
jgi:DNA polymerase I-like protein with 3'-5' exonuclease and polymerase domains